MYDSNQRPNTEDTAIESGGENKQGDSGAIPQQDQNDTIVDSEATQGGLRDTDEQGGDRRYS